MPVGRNLVAQARPAGRACLNTMYVLNHHEKGMYPKVTFIFIYFIEI